MSSNLEVVACCKWSKLARDRGDDHIIGCKLQVYVESYSVSFKIDCLLFTFSLMYLTYVGKMETQWPLNVQQRSLLSAIQLGIYPSWKRPMLMVGIICVAVDILAIVILGVVFSMVFLEKVTK